VTTPENNIEKNLKASEKEKDEDFNEKYFCGIY